eukprot:TRINITY_DN5707_c0_g1_i14.p1 TRINITY_DN5707_c0_g1~~TRINITY_DN5707_c0_g1_i14.p1  ORF type:complete len:491 (+),score=86.45 TRINITY_DN5707_c0_g1_i14:170-1642(+)
MNSSQTVGTILCCLCGASIVSNPANMCANCLRSQVDITEGISKQVTCFWCKGCGRYLNPPNFWLHAELESNELLAYCLKRMKGLNKVKLIDASWVWTEPHSKRLKVKLTIQKEAFRGTILQQTFIVEFIVQNFFCPDCHRIEAKDTWDSVAQVRQHVDHMRTFLWLEQMILKYKANTHCVKIKEHPEGLDFYFSVQNHCTKFIGFLESILPVRWAIAKQLQSHDQKSNVFRYTYSYSIEIPTICKDTLVCFPLKLARQLGGISPLMLCWKVSNVLHFIDPFTLREIALGGEYWNYGFGHCCDRSHLQEFVVLDIEPLGEKRGKVSLAEVVVARASDLGKNNVTFNTVTHLGNILQHGDSVAGYDLSTVIVNDVNLEALKDKNIRSEIILVRKLYPNRRKKNRKRHWALQKLDVEETPNQKQHNKSSKMQDEEEFMRELEEDPEMRSQIDLFKVPNVAPPQDDMNDDDDVEPDFPEVQIGELLDAITDLRL